MIARWEIASEAVSERLTRDRDLAKQLAGYLPTVRVNWAAADPGLWGRQLVGGAWRKPAEEMGIRHLYGAAIAFANDRYLLSPKTVTQLTSELDRIAAQSAPLSHDVTVAYGAPLPAELRPRSVLAPAPKRPAPRPPCRGTGSFPCRR